MGQNWQEGICLFSHLFQVKYQTASEAALSDLNGAFGSVFGFAETKLGDRS